MFCAGRGISNADYDMIGDSVEHVLATALSRTDVKSWMHAWKVFTDAMKTKDDTLPPPPPESAAAVREIDHSELVRHNAIGDAWLGERDLVVFLSLTALVPQLQRLTDSCTM